MQVLAWIIRIAIVLVLVWFALKNSHEISINGLPGQSWHSPLIFVVLVAFVSGVAVGLLAWLPAVVRQRREAGRLRKSARSATTAAPTIAASGPAAEASAGVTSPPVDHHGV